MDAAVIAAIARWPDVPHVHGWLSLDRRGQWRLQESPITNAHISDFIGRNYEHDDRGAWFFQNGPQRVYVRLDYTPWALRIGDGLQLLTHTGCPVEDPRAAFLDDEGNVLLAFAAGVGLVDDRDLGRLLDATHRTDGTPAADADLLHLMQGEPMPLMLCWNGLQLPFEPIHRSEVASRFGFIADPQPTTACRAN